MTYSDELPEGAINGCDGCMGPTGMGVDFGREHNKDHPNVNRTNNNGLGFTADILEEIWTNPNFPKPKGDPIEGPSLKDRGVSRADLWAFASWLVVKIGVSNNNFACNNKENKIKGGGPRNCGHVLDPYDENLCIIDWPRIPKFRTGRKDCTEVDY